MRATVVAGWMVMGATGSASARTKRLRSLVGWWSKRLWSLAVRVDRAQGKSDPGRSWRQEGRSKCSKKATLVAHGCARKKRLGVKAKKNCGGFSHTPISPSATPRGARLLLLALRARTPTSRRGRRDLAALLRLAALRDHPGRRAASAPRPADDLRPARATLADHADDRCALPPVPLRGVALPGRRRPPLRSAPPPSILGVELVREVAPRPAWGNGRRVWKATPLPPQTPPFPNEQKTMSKLRSDGSQKNWARGRHP